MPRFARLAAAGGIALAATMSSGADAFMCMPETRIVCWTYGTVCGQVPDPDKVAIYELLCESFA